MRAFKFLRGQTRNEKPAVESGGLPEPIGSNPQQKDATNMPTGLTARKAQDTEQLDLWMQQGRDDVFSVTALVTPKMAEALLTRNGGNRPVVWTGASRSVAAYAAAMTRGEWVLNGEPIIISATGELNDGQHRLHAIVQSGVAVQLMLTFGVERGTRHTVDQGVARTPGHILSMFGEKDGNNLGTALQFLWTRDTEQTLHARPSSDQLIATLAIHPEVRESLVAVGSVAAHYRLSKGYMAAVHYLARRHDAFKADQFLKAVTTGLNITTINSPVNKLRKQYEEHSAKRKRIDKIEQAALYIKAFNMFCRGRTGAVQWRDSGPTAEAFPVVGG